LRALGKLGVRRLNYLTDDPWNPHHQAGWFLAALPHYDEVYSPRRSNLADLEQCGCRTVSYLPFGYDPALHFPEVPAGAKRGDFPQTDVIFVGGGDADRVPYVTALKEAKFRIELYGSYWDRYRPTRGLTRGQINVGNLRLATREAKISLCLLRKANRDGHVMRSFEIPAIGSCMLVEHSEEHEAIFGANEESVLFFRTVPEMVARCHRLCQDDSLRRHLAEAVHQRIVGGANTYADRLRQMLLAQDGAAPVHVGAPAKTWRSDTC
jgi:spore maturation protein CgeB